MKPLAIILLTILALTCTKERSCEGCYFPLPADTIPAVDTAKTFIIQYNIQVDSNYKLSHIEPEFKSKYRDFYDFYIIGKETDDSAYTFIGRYDAVDEMEYLQKGDTGFIRYAFVWIDRTQTQTEITDTLIK